MTTFHRCAAACLAAAVLLCAPMAQAIAPRGADAHASTPAAVAGQATLDQLARKAAAGGSVRLVLQVALPRPFAPEGQLPPQAIARQRAGIARAQDAVLAALSRQNARPYHRYSAVPALAVEADAAALDLLRRSPLVTLIQEDVPVPATLASSTTLIGAPAVWSAGLDGTGQAVVVLDTGIDRDHPFFRDGAGNSRIVAEACFSNGRGTAGKLSLCPNGSGSQAGAGSADAETPACLNGTAQLCSHGSHVAGIAAGMGSSFDGVAPGAGIIAIQVFTRFESSTDCSPRAAPCVLSYNSDQLAALDHVYTALHPVHTIAAVNMSLGGGSNTSHCDADARKTAIDNLRSVGIATVIATGNDGFTNAIGTPACISTAVAVGSSTDADLVSSFSNMHAMMHLMAPGSSIDSAVPGNGFARFNGTSMATPHVAGAWAVMKQRVPGASVTDVLAALATTGVRVTDTRTGGTVTKPRIRLDAAVAALVPNTWEGDLGTDWNTPGNWSRNAVPTCAEQALIPSAAVAFPELSADAAARDLLIEAGASVSMRAHTLRICHSLDVDAAGRFDMTGGTLFFDGGTATTLALPAGSYRLHNVQVGDGAQAKALTLGAPLALAGDLVVRAGGSLASNGHALVFHGGSQRLALPADGTVTYYRNGLDDSTGWSVLDANGDGVSWGVSTSTEAPNAPATGAHGRYSWNTNGTTAANDWLFSPGVALQAGVPYTIRFKYGARHASYPERITAAIGTSATVAAMGTPLFTHDNVTNTSWNTASATFTPNSSGTFHLGFHARSLADQYQLAIDELRVEVPGVALDTIEVATGAKVTLDVPVPLALAGNLQVDGTLDLGRAELQVAGTVTNNGTLRATRDAAGGATTRFLHLVGADGASRYRGVDLTPAASMGSTTVSVSGNADCTAVGDDVLFRRCFDVAPGAAAQATVRFWLTEGERNGVETGAARALRWNGSAWADASGSGTHLRSTTQAACTSAEGATQCWVESAAVTEYPLFVVGTSADGSPGGGTPTAFTVTPSAGSHGSISPSAPQTVAQGATTSFTVTPDAGYLATVGGSCGGTLVDTTYTDTTDVVTADCTVRALFDPMPPTTMTLQADASATRAQLPVVFTATVSAETSAPLDGQVVVTASTGESCTAATADLVTDTQARFRCEIRLDVHGPRTVGARFSGSKSHLASDAAASSLSVVREADLSVAVTALAGPYAEGAVRSVLVTVRNAGPDAAPLSGLVMIADPAFVNASWSCVGEGGASCAASGTGDVELLADLPASSRIDLLLEGAIPAPLPSAIRFEAVATTDGAAPAYAVETQPGDNSATALLQPSGVFRDGFE